jgi:hypothetical protein
MSDKELDPCTICGTIPDIRISLPSGMAMVECHECVIETPSFYDAQTAVKYWNEVINTN